MTPRKHAEKALGLEPRTVLMFSEEDERRQRIWPLLKPVERAISEAVAEAVSEERARVVEWLRGRIHHDGVKLVNDLAEFWSDEISCGAHLPESSGGGR